MCENILFSIPLHTKKIIIIYKKIILYTMKPFIKTDPKNMFIFYKIWFWFTRKCGFETNEMFLVYKNDFLKFYNRISYARNGKKIVFLLFHFSNCNFINFLFWLSFLFDLNHFNSISKLYPIPWGYMLRL